jgi:hypothetical protein
MVTVELKWQVFINEARAVSEHNGMVAQVKTTDSPAKGRAMAQAVSRRSSTVEARVSPCGVCGGQSGTGTGFSPSCRFSPVNFIPLVLHYV